MCFLSVVSCEMQGVTLNVVFTSATCVDCLLGTLGAGEEEGEAGEARASFCQQRAGRRAAAVGSAFPWHVCHGLGKGEHSVAIEGAPSSPGHFRQ